MWERVFSSEESVGKAPAAVWEREFSSESEVPLAVWEREFPGESEVPVVQKLHGSVCVCMYEAETVIVLIVCCIVI